MNNLTALITEIKQEAKNTEKILALVPADQFGWKPHEKSMRLKRLADHIVGLADWPRTIIHSDYLDFTEKRPPTPETHSAEDMVREFKKNTEASLKALDEMKEEDLNKNWVLRNGDYVILDLPKRVVIRSMAMNHTYHHRAQLGVYLRLLDIPIPGMYGPSADDLA